MFVVFDVFLINTDEICCVYGWILWRNELMCFGMSCGLDLIIGLSCFVWNLKTIRVKRVLRMGNLLMSTFT